MALPKLIPHILEEIGHCKNFAFSDIGDMHVVVFKQEKKTKTITTKKSFLLQCIKVLHNLMDITERAGNDTVDTFKILIRHKDPRF